MGRAAVGNVSELVVDATGGGAAAPSSTVSEGTAAAAGLLIATGLCGTAAAGWDSAGAGATASGGAGVVGMETTGTALIVPMAEETAACVVGGAGAG